MITLFADALGAGSCNTVANPVSANTGTGWGSTRYFAGKCALLVDVRVYSFSVWRCDL